MGLQAATRTLHPLGRPHRHHQGLDLLERVVADRFTGLLLQGRPDLIIGDPAAVLRDQGDQGIGEVGEDRHQSELWEGGAQVGRTWDWTSTLVWMVSRCLGGHETGQSPPE
jgi:hypothetical protein